MPNTAEGRAQFLARYRQLLVDVNARMPEYFRTVPKEMPNVERLPESLEVGAAGAQYQSPAMDGSRPGIFQVNERDLNESPTWAMKTLAYHEGIPGHHFQDSIAQQLKDLPFIRQLGILHGVRGRVGAVCGAFRRRDRQCTRMILWVTFGRLQSEIFSRRAPGRRYRHPRQGLDTRAGDSIHD